MYECDAAFLLLKRSKTSYRQLAKVQHLKITNLHAVKLLNSVYQGAARHELLFFGSAHVFRRRWDFLLRILEIPEYVHVTPGGLRGGGAVAFYRKGWSHVGHAAQTSQHPWSLSAGSRCFVSCWLRSLCRHAEQFEVLPLCLPSWPFLRDDSTTRGLVWLLCCPLDPSEPFSMVVEVSVLAALWWQMALFELRLMVACFVSVELFFMGYDFVGSIFSLASAVLSCCLRCATLAILALRKRAS